MQFACQQSPKDNHSERLQPKASGVDALLRRGNTLVLRITLSAQIACPYCVSLTFVPVFRPRDRFGQFQAKGDAKGTSELWLSITVPANFPVGKYHAHIAVALRGGAHVITYFHHKPIIVLFNPWNPGYYITVWLICAKNDLRISDKTMTGFFGVVGLGIVHMLTCQYFNIITSFLNSMCVIG